MGNISVPNNDIAPSQFQQPNWIRNEIPTSSKLEIWANQEGQEFGILSEIIGNTFYNGISNLAGGLGNLAQLTVPSSDGTIAIPGPQFSADGNINECTVAAITGASNPYLITLSAGQTISTNNIVIDSSDASLYLIINIMLITKNGSGIITGAYPAIFRPTFGTGTPNNTNLNQFWIYFDNPTTPSSLTNIYIEVVNYSVADVAAQNSLNIGGLQYGRLQGYTSGSDNTAVLSPTGTLPSLTQELNAIENKSFAVQWHAMVTSSNATLNPPNYQWTLNSSTIGTIWQNGSLPTQGQIIQALTVAPNSIGQASIPNAAYACLGGIPILQTNGIPVPVGVNISGGNITLSLPTSMFAGTPINTQNIDIYFPVMIPYRMLFTVGFNYTDLGSRLTDFLNGVIGAQYGWNNTTPQYNATPVPIATRLDQDEAATNVLTTRINGISSFLNYWSSTPTNFGPFTVPSGVTIIKIWVANNFKQSIAPAWASYRPLSVNPGDQITLNGNVSYAYVTQNGNNILGSDNGNAQWAQVLLPVYSAGNFGGGGPSMVINY